jgi:hypothetical protein
MMKNLTSAEFVLRVRERFERAVSDTALNSSSSRISFAREAGIRDALGWVLGEYEEEPE